MSDVQDPGGGDEGAWGFAPPPFDSAQALQRLRRDLRDLGLTEREGVFEKRGLAVAKARVEGSTLEVAWVQQPMRSGPRWESRTLRDSAALRDWTSGLKRKLAQWSDRDD